MDKKSKIFFAVFFTLIAGTVIVTYMKYFVAKDYYIEAQADCDPYTEKCFVWKCDPNATDESEKCTGDPEKDIWYFQKVKKVANLVPLCNPDDENCDALSCSPGMDCEVTYCDEKTVGEGEECNDPVKYTEENPVKEEGDSEEVEECAPDDQECINSDQSGSEENADTGDAGGDINNSESGTTDNGANP
jgi:hypothetical protein